MAPQVLERFARNVGASAIQIAPRACKRASGTRVWFLNSESLVRDHIQIMGEGTFVRCLGPFCISHVVADSEMHCLSMNDIKALLLRWDLDKTSKVFYYEWINIHVFGTGQGQWVQCEKRWHESWNVLTWVQVPLSRVSKHIPVQLCFGAVASTTSGAPVGATSGTRMAGGSTDMPIDVAISVPAGPVETEHPLESGHLVINPPAGPVEFEHVATHVPNGPVDFEHAGFESTTGDSDDLHPRGLRRTEFWAAMNEREKRYIKEYEQRWPGCAYAVTQDPRARPLRSTTDRLHTMIKSHTATWIDDAQRIMTFSECLLSQGFPMYVDLFPLNFKLERTPVCSFAFPSKRSHPAACGQAGNTMHCNVVAALWVYVFICIRLDKGLANVCRIRSMLQDGAGDGEMETAPDKVPDNPPVQERDWEAMAGADIVTDLAEMFDYMNYIYAKVVLKWGLSALHEIEAAMADMDYTTAFSGIDAPGCAVETCKANLGRLLGRHVLGLRHKGAIEWYGPSQNELLNNVAVPDHCYDDISSFFVCSSVTKMYEQVHGLISFRSCVKRDACLMIPCVVVQSCSYLLSVLLMHYATLIF